MIEETHHKIDKTLQEAPLSEPLVDGEFTLYTPFAKHSSLKTKYEAEYTISPFQRRIIKPWHEMIDNRG